MTCFPKSCRALNSQAMPHAAPEGRGIFSSKPWCLARSAVTLAAACCVFLALMMAGCATDPALQFSSIMTHEAKSGDDTGISHAEFLKMLDQAYTSYEFAPGFNAEFDIKTYLTQNPDQEHFPNSIRFYETPCIASREILMAKGDVRYRNRPEFIQFMQAWEAGTAPTPTEADIRYLADLTHLERITKQHIFKSAGNYCHALGGLMVNTTPLDEKAVQSFFLPVVAHCSMDAQRKFPEHASKPLPPSPPGPESRQSFLFIYNPNILNNSYGYIPEKLRRHQLVPFHQRRKETDAFYGHSTVTMITATEECLRTYPVDFDQETGVMLYGWDGYHLFVHPEYPRDSGDPRIIYFDRYRKNWPGSDRDAAPLNAPPTSD